MTDATIILTDKPRSSFFGLLNWWKTMVRDRRDLRKLNKLDDHMLEDMGLDRKQVNDAFYTRFGSHRWQPRGN